MNRFPSPSKARLTVSGFLVFAASAIMLAAASPMLALGGCDRKPTTTAGPTAGPIHTVRGRVMKLPIPGDPSSSFSVFHEAIPQWLRPDGTRGMNAMVMPFPPAQGLSLEGITPGDLVELSVQQHTTGPLPYEATRVTKLPPDTRLDLPEVGK